MSSPAADVGTVRELLDALAAVLDSGDIPDASNEARDLLSALFDVPRYWPVVNGAAAVEAPMWEQALRAAHARAGGAPLAYAVGRAAFRHLTLDVDARVLIPRPETERLVDLVLEETAGLREGIVVDVGTGSGAIAIALACEGNGRFSRVYATDISLDAIDVARRNVGRLAPGGGPPIEILHGSLLAPLGRVRPHVVVSNPPYIALDEAAALPPSVRDWEPSSALFSGMDGMMATSALVHDAATVLSPGGLLAVEVDARRASRVAELVGRERAFHSIRVELDLTGRERFVLARRHEEGAE